MSKLYRRFCDCVAIFACASIAEAANKTWTSAVSGDFGAAANWIGGVPTSVDSATFSTAGTYTVTFDNSPALANPVLNQDLFLQAGTVTLTSGNDGACTYHLQGLGGDDAVITGGSVTLGTSGHTLHMIVDDDLRIRGGASMFDNFGSDITTVDLFLGDSTAPTGNGTLVIDGAGSSLTVSGSAQIGTGGQTGTLTVRNNATADFNGTLGLADASSSHFSTGVVSIESGAAITTANIRIAPNATNGQTGTFSVGSDSGTSSVTQDINATLIVGAALGGPTPNSGTLNLDYGGVFNSGTGTGAITVNPTGTIKIADGTLNANGNVTIDGGLLQRSDISSEFAWAAGKTMNIQNGGRAKLRNFFIPANANVNVTGVGSLLYADDFSFGELNISNGAQINVSSGGHVLAETHLYIGFTSNGSLTVDGSDSAASSYGDANFWGINGGTATVSFSNSAVGFISGDLRLANSATAGTAANVTIQSSAALYTDRLTIGYNGATTSATMNINGTGSSVYVDESTTLNTTAIININGGIASLSTLTDNGGTINFNSGSLYYRGNLTIGAGGLLGSDLTLASDRLLSIRGTTTIDPGRTLTVSGGTMNADKLVIDGTLAFISGTLGSALGGAIHIEGTGAFKVGASVSLPIDGDDVTISVTGSGISLGSATSLNGFNHRGVLNVGSNIITLNSAGYAQLGALTSLTGGTINAPNGIHLPGGSNLSGKGAVNARFTGDSGSVIEATGALALGDAASPAGYNYGGEVRTKQFSVTLNTSAQAGLGNLTTLGNSASPGSLTVTNGYAIDFAEALTGYGTVNSTNTLAKRAVIDGSVQGSSAAQPITLTGYIKGLGTFDNVVFTGTFSPGLSSTIVSAGSISLASTNTLIMEVGGQEAGTGYDKIEATGAVTLNGALNVSLLGGFVPVVGNSFDILDWSALVGTFSSLQLPTLASGLAWNTSQLYTTGVLSVASAGVPGDYNNNGVDDAADYVLWRKGGPLTNEVDMPGTINDADYTAWRARFGNISGSGSGTTSFSSTAVPEPAMLMLMILAVGAYIRSGAGRHG